MSQDQAGISTNEAVANQFLSGAQQQSVIGALGKVTEAARRRAPGIREAAAKANALRHAQDARIVAGSRGAGVVAGGGLPGASGTKALAGMKEAAARTVAAEQAALDAEVTAAKVGAEEKVETAAIQAESQAAIGNFVTSIGTLISEASQSNTNPASVGEEVAGKLDGLDVKDPAQRTAAIRGLGVWLKQRGWPATPEFLARVVDAGKAGDVAGKAGLIRPQAPEDLAFTSPEAQLDVLFPRPHGAE